jgi:hypothetical protein
MPATATELTEIMRLPPNTVNPPDGMAGLEWIDPSTLSITACRPEQRDALWCTGVAATDCSSIPRETVGVQ